MDWLRKPAIQWTAELTPSNDAAATCPYWHQDLIALLSSLGTLTDDNKDDNGQCSISYEALLVAALAIVNNVRQRLNEMTLDELEDTHQGSTHQQVGVSVVVAIPEGPFLPLAILVVHLLNEPIMTDTDAQTSTAAFAVLVPVEPGEGKERLRRQLEDLQPSIVLCLSGKDSDKVDDVLSCIQPRATAITDEGLLCDARPSLVDFGEVIRNAIEGIAPAELVRIRARLTACIDELKNQQTFFPGLSKCQQGGCGNATIDVNDARELSTGNRVSHIVFTSGTTGVPKGCISSIQSLRHYLAVKNEAHGIASESNVLLASALSFDPCLSDILATFAARATLVICSRAALIQNLATVLKESQVTHVLCTPTLWGMLHGSGARPLDLPSLQVVALGGEVIPKHIVKTWARDKRLEANDTSLRLCATYGVTEACVYQTFGELWREEDDAFWGQNVGKPLRGLGVRIRETSKCDTVETAMFGEIVLQGKQIDGYSSYLNKEQLSREKFFKTSSTREQSDDGGCDDEQEYYCYSTGDRGCIESATNDVYIMGRIDGEDGMVKVNGVRVELGEIENALIDDALVTACLAADREMDDGSKQIHAFCVLSAPGLLETGLNGAVESEPGILLAPWPLLLLLRTRCIERVRAGVIPSAFVVIERLPLSPTGKRDRRRLPRLSDCISLGALRDGCENNSTPLWQYGSSGATVAEQVVDCLNLQSFQHHLVTTNVRFGVLGGDSLAATRVVRSLYAHHHRVFNSRFLGGKYGTLEGPFAVSHLLQAKSMGEYVDWLDSHDVCGSTTASNGNAGAETDKGDENGVVEKEDDDDDDSNHHEKDDAFRLYEALLEAATSGQSLVACSLLDLGVDPNADDHGGRLGKTSGGNARKRLFRSNPLHLACIKGDEVLVKKLIENGCKLNSPDAAGSFPIHLAASSTNSSSGDGARSADSESDEDRRRYECVKSLLEAGAPLTMKDSNKQTVLHCAARSGHCKLLRYLLGRWSNVGGDKERTKQASKLMTSPYDWRDRWFRTPVHWAVLNGNVEALAILLDGGCSPDPPKPKASNRQTSAAIESPIQICERLYGGTDIGNQITNILLGHDNKGFLTGFYLLLALAIVESATIQPL